MQQQQQQQQQSPIIWKWSGGGRTEQQLVVVLNESTAIMHFLLFQEAWVQPEACKAPERASFVCRLLCPTSHLKILSDADYNGLNHSLPSPFLTI